MKPTLKTLAATLVASTALATAAQAASIDIENFIGAIEVKIGATTEATLDGGSKTFPGTLDVTGDRVSLQGPKNYIDNWSRDVRKGGWGWNDEDFVRWLAEYPTLRVTVPAGSSLTIDGVVTRATVGDLGGDLVVGAGYVDATVGNVRTARVGVHSSADFRLGDVAESLEASIHGSGDFTGKTAATATLSVHGSGDIQVSDISSDVDAEIHGSGNIVMRKIGAAKFGIHGSGDINADTVGGALEADIHGSGDVIVTDVSGGARLEVNGSGDIEIASISGAGDAEVRGSGTIDIRGGRANRFDIRTNGSGDVNFGGTVDGPIYVRSNGSSSVRVHAHTGSVDFRGKGDVVIAGKRYKDDD